MRREVTFQRDRTEQTFRFWGNPEHLEDVVRIIDRSVLYCDPDIGLFEDKNTFNQNTRFL